MGVTRLRLVTALLVSVLVGGAVWAALSDKPMLEAKIVKKGRVLRPTHPPIKLKNPPKREPSTTTSNALDPLAGPTQSASKSPIDTTLASFTNWETPVVHPIHLSPDGTRLAVANLPDGRVELFDVTGALPVLTNTVPVGVDPVSVRFRTNDELWVVNHISDSVSVVDLNSMSVLATIQTLDEPTDVVFAGNPERAFVSISQENAIQVFDPVSFALVSDVPIGAEEPRALAVSPDGTKVYAAIFESGNKTTYVIGDTETEVFLQLGTNDPAGPYGGQNPPPNDGASFNPPINPALPAPPATSIIVRQSEDPPFNWLDDNGGNWTSYITGARAGLNFRYTGWWMPDRDVAVVDTSNLGVSYATSLMNLNMSLDVNPTSGEIVVVGTDGTNEIRFEPNIKGTFVRTQYATVAPGTLTRSGRVDLNDHLDYLVPTLPQTERDKSIADPRGIAISSDGTKTYITGMGSNNMVIVDATGARVGAAPTIELGEGPTGIALDEPRQRAYVLNRFESSLSVVDTATESEVARVPFFDPTPDVIKIGRPHLYDAHETSGLGQLSCAACHVDSRTDRLAWDLGDPSGDMIPLGDRNLANNTPGLNDPALFGDYHPMKGPMMTQTLQDIIGHEPFHFRGDKLGIEGFNAAYENLQGDDEQLSPVEMQQFEDFLQTITYPPNPFREFDNTLPTSLPLTDHAASGQFSDEGGLAAGQPLPNGNAQNGMVLYRGTTGRNLDNGDVTCVVCHALPTGAGSEMTANGLFYEPSPVGPQGERKQAISGSDNFTQQSFKIQGFRNAYEKVGMEVTTAPTRAGFGFGHQGRVPDLANFLGGFTVESDQEIADLIAFMLSLSGSDLPGGSAFVGDLMPEGTPSQDSHAAAGKQVTITSTAPVPLFGRPDAVAAMLDLARNRTDRLELIARGMVDGRHRGFTFDAVSDTFLSDRNGESLTTTQVEALASSSAPLTYTLVPAGNGTRLGINRDEDPALDDDDCAPADPTQWVRAPNVSNLLLTHAGQTTLTWDAVAAPDVTFDILSGTAGDLRSLGLAPATSCVADQVATESWLDTRPNLPAGEITFYLTRSRNACGPGDAGPGREALRSVSCP